MCVCVCPTSVSVCHCAERQIMLRSKMLQTDQMENTEGLHPQAESFFLLKVRWCVCVCVCVCMCARECALPLLLVGPCDGQHRLGRPADQPADTPMGRQAYGPTARRTNRPTDRPADRPTDRPADPPIAGRPATETTPNADAGKCWQNIGAEEAASGACAVSPMPGYTF